LAQTNPAWELVVVDNGNSEAVADIVRTFQDPRIRLLRQENRGYRGGVMAAAAIAQGDYFCVLDSDDLLTPQFAEVMLDYLDRHPEVDAVGCDAHLFVDGEQGESGRGYLRSIGEAPPSPQGDVLTVDDVLGGRVPYYTSAIREAAWQAVGGYEPGVAGVDESVLIWLRLASDFEVRLIPAKLSRYRVRGESLSREPAKVEEFESALIRTFEIFARESADPRHADVVEAPIRRLRYHQALRRARSAFSQNDIPASRRFARDAFHQRQTLRAGAIVLLLKLSPSLLKSAYPLKQRIQRTARRLRPRATHRSS
jgi:glycosyltransferase involved in cell wall biosynthesis